MELKSIALILFVLMYIVMILKSDWKLYAIWIVAIAFVALGIIKRNPFYILSVVNWNVLMMIGGTMLVVYFFIESKMPNLLADIILDKCKNVMWVIILMSLFSGAVSAFIDNVATVLMIAPVGLAICKKLDISPVSMLLSIAVSSNLQGAATLVGDTTSIMLGDYADMNFMEFFWMNGRPGIFWAVELGALMTVPVMMILFHKYTQPVEAGKKTEVKEMFPTIALCGIVVCLIIASFIPNTPSVINGAICMTIAVICVLYDYVKKREKLNIIHAFASVDIETLLVLCGLFVVIRGITDVGLIDDAASLIVNAGGNNLFVLYTIIVWGSVLFSAFIDNIPYVATMLPILTSITALLGIEPYVLYFGLLTGATLGGNITPIGASANITAVGMLKKGGHDVSFGDFMKIGLPFTLVAATTGYLFIWIFWH
ncbi:SLC13 family permease [Oribacterium sp. FC2011]|uniref:SLC13 family permease n=1 Tax=Oribacterium sp. FC2011 TaxID=1408311 RepID=UPI0004E14516|nr:SLC13 family permease [Oribacterium sp. FC2011]